MNNNNSFANQSINLFTLDVEKLYPSIQPRYAIEALQDMLMNVEEEDRKIAEAIEAFVKLSFEESYITFQDEVFKPKIFPQEEAYHVKSRTFYYTGYYSRK